MGTFWVRVGASRGSARPLEVQTVVDFGSSSVEY